MARWLMLAVVCVFISSCSTSDDIEEVQPPRSEAPVTTSTSTATSTSPTTTPPVEPQAVVRVIRPDWDSSMAATSIVMLVLEEVGYVVEDVSRVNGGRSDVMYDRLAKSEADLSLAARLPQHRPWLESRVEGRPDQVIGDLVNVIEPPMTPAGGVQGFLVTKTWVEEAGITHLGQINDDPLLAAALDRDGDGLGEIYGCSADWTCDDIIIAFMHFNEWESLEQLMDSPRATDVAPYDAMFERFLELVDRREPAVAYVWTPTSYFAEAEIGEKTLWLSVTNDAALNGTKYLHDTPHDPQEWLLNPDGTAGFTDLPADICTQGPDGCQLGWAGASIHAAANAEWLAANPNALALLEAIELDTIEVSQLLAELEQRELDEWSDKVDASMEIARAWVDANPERVAAWLDAALAS